ncbi:Glycosyl transferase, group 2 family protein (fragment) [Mesorhizobium sp. STM 4661]
MKSLKADRKIYFVQSDERFFYDDTETKAMVASTYRQDFEFVTIASWVREFLDREFGQKAALVANGIDLDVFVESRGLRSVGRPRVLIEGPLSVPWKGVADAYAAVRDLDVDIWLVASDGIVPVEWRLDRVFKAVPQNEMPEIYSSCDILLKMSHVESFCLPALEAMACGCAVVVGKVNGATEFVRHEHNSLVVERGDIASAKNAVMRLLENPVLRKRLVEEGRRTAQSLSVKASFSAMEEVIGAPV